MKTQTIFKIILIVVMIDFAKTMQKVQDMCINLKNNQEDHFTKFYHKNSIDLIINKENGTKEIGNGSYGKVYKVKYFPESETEPTDIAMKFIVINNFNKDLVQKEIAVMREFSVLSSSKYMQFLECYYETQFSDRTYKDEITKVIIATELLDDDLGSKRSDFRALPELLRYQQYSKLFEDLIYLHNDFPTDQKKNLAIFRQ